MGKGSLALEPVGLIPLMKTVMSNSFQEARNLTKKNILNEGEPSFGQKEESFKSIKHCNKLFLINKLHVYSV